MLIYHHVSVIDIHLCIIAHVVVDVAEELYSDLQPATLNSLKPNLHIPDMATITAHDLRETQISIVATCSATLHYLLD